MSDSKRVESISIARITGILSILIILAPPLAAARAQQMGGSGHSLDANLRIGSGGYNGGGGDGGGGLQRGAYSARQGGIDLYNAFLDERAYTPRPSTAGDFPGRIDNRAGAASGSSGSGAPRQVAGWSPPDTGFSEAYDPGYEASLGDSHYESETAQQQANTLAYGIGFSIGEEVRKVLEQDHAGADLPSIITGFRDAVQNSLPRVSEAEMEELLHALFERITGERTSQRLLADPQFKAELERNEASGQALHEKLAHDPDVVTLDNGLQYKEVVEGTGDMPTATDRVLVEYRLISTEGEYVTEPLQQSVRLSSTLEGVQIALTTMKVGGVRRVAVPSSLAHGVNGRPPLHGPGVTLYYEVELLAIQ